MNKHLKIIETSPSSGSLPPSFSRYSRQKEKQAKFERLWLFDSEQFNPLRNWMQKERLERTWTLLTTHVELNRKKIVDIGCGEGVFSRRLRDKGAQVVALDIAENALKKLKLHSMDNIEPKQGAMPDTRLGDHAFDIVVCTEIIAELDKEDYRLFFAELARVVHTEGYVLCSSSIDIQTEDGVSRLLELAQTEFEIIDSKTSYHAFFIKLKQKLEYPMKLIHLWKNPYEKQKELSNQSSFKKTWLNLQTSSFLIWFWFLLNPLCQGLLKPFYKSRSFLLWLESLCEFIWHEKGVSHFIFLAKRKALITVAEKERPIEKLGRKEIWN
jgi:2-polyprenyl-3-methyl-5-hydroxy-6-metoxy-1,4-benzoquinol methylase